MTLKNIVYQKALIQTFHISFLTIKNLCEFTAREHKFKKKLFCIQKPGLNVHFKDFWYIIKILLRFGMAN